MYYRHEKSDCLKPSYLRAIGLENLVYDTLHKKLSDQQALFKATKKATPTASDQKTLQRKITKAEAGLKQTKRQMDNIIRKISLDLLSDDEAKSILDELREKKQYFLDQIDELKAELKPLPTDSTSATTEKKGRQQKCK